MSTPNLRPHEIAVAACGILGMVCGAFAFALAGQAMTEAKEAREELRALDLAIQHHEDQWMRLQQRQNDLVAHWRPLVQPWAQERGLLQAGASWSPLTIEAVLEPIGRAVELPTSERGR
jgi:hypothetical protein